MAHADRARDPCPWVILNDSGGAFSMGCIGGAIWYAIKGSRNSPRVSVANFVRALSSVSHHRILQGSRLPGAVAAVKARAPVLGGNFGIWGTMFSTFDCTVKGVRQKEDYWNSIIAGFMTGGSLAFRGTCNEACLSFYLTSSLYCSGSQDSCWLWNHVRHLIRMLRG